MSLLNKGKDGILLSKTLGIVSNVIVEEFLESVNVAYLQPQRNNEWSVLTLAGKYENLTIVANSSRPHVYFLAPPEIRPIDGKSSPASDLKIRVPIESPFGAPNGVEIPEIGHILLTFHIHKRWL